MTDDEIRSAADATIEGAMDRVTPERASQEEAVDFLDAVIQGLRDWRSTIQSELDRA